MTTLALLFLALAAWGAIVWILIAWEERAKRDEIERWRKERRGG